MPSSRSDDVTAVLQAFGHDVLHDGTPQKPRHGVAGIATEIGQLALRTALPATCAGCGMSGTWMCSSCEQSIRAIDQSSVCHRCGYPDCEGELVCGRCHAWVDELMASRSAFAFTGSIRSTVHLLKYRNEPARASWCAAAMAKRLMLDQWEIDAFVPVPLHDSRVRARGYNQSERIAVELSALTGIPSLAALRRVRPTISQVNLGAQERRDNVRDAFSAVGQLNGLTIALVDDVITTGSTLQESARALVHAGATCVVAASFSQEVFETQASRRM